MGMPTVAWNKGFSYKVPTDDGEMNLLGIDFSYSLSLNFFNIEKVKEIFIKHVLPTDILIDISREASFRRAINFGRKVAGSKKVRYEQVRNDDDTSFQYFEVLSNGESLEFEMKAEVCWSKSLDNVKCDDPFVEAQVRERMSFCRENYNKNDLLIIFKRLFKGTGFTAKRPHDGGEYFASAYAAQIVYTLENVIRELDPNAIFNITELPKTFHNKETVKTAYIDTLNMKLKFARSNWEKVLKMGKKLSKTKFENGIESIQNEMNELEIIADSTGYALDEARALCKKTDEALKLIMIKSDADTLPQWLQDEIDEVKLTKSDLKLMKKNGEDISDADIDGTDEE